MPSINSNPIKILLLENDRGDAEHLGKYLELAQLDYRMATARRLSEGLEMLQTESFDVILLDLYLPDSQGISTLKAVQERASSTALVLMTDSEDQALSFEALQAGANDYLHRDKLSAEDMRRSMRYATERTNLARELEAHASEIEHRETILRSIFDANTDAMLILTPEYEIRFFNQAAATLLEADVTRLIGETFPFEVSTSQLSELEIPEANGDTRLVELSAVDLDWESERALLVMLRDITKRRLAEVALEREKERFSVTVDSISDAVIATDKDGAVERMNQEACRLTGVSSKEAVGKAIFEVLRLKRPKSGKLIEDPIKELLSRDYADSFSKDGLLLQRGDKLEPLLVIAETRCILDEIGGHLGCITVLRDITKQKKVEEELFKNEKLNSISLLASGIAHDFNNMLTAILGNISVVRMNTGADDENSKKLLAVETAALQAKLLTQQLLTFSKGGALAQEVTTIEQLVEECARFVLRGSNVKCEVEKEDSLWAVDVHKGQISQVINNLIINADQSMPTGGTISLKLSNCRLRHAEVPTLKAGEYVCIKVTDQGIGISQENLKRIFDPYFTTKAEGSGLGLASSHSIVRNHNGAITVESEMGRGTCFSIYLPKTEKAEKARKNAGASERPTARTEPEAIHKGRGRILVMDDMEAMMLVAGEILNALGYDVEFATNGEEAIESYKKAKESGNRFDAVVFDLTVPGGMGGEEASNILIQYDPELIAIASSGYTTSNVMSDYTDSAFKAVVPKPYRIKEMSNALHRVLRTER
ncbi:MAG: response regulator [Opitutales bacterium]